MIIDLLEYPKKSLFFLGLYVEFKGFRVRVQGYRIVDVLIREGLSSIFMPLRVSQAVLWFPPLWGES